MFTIENERTNFLLKVWLEQVSDLEESCLEQAYNLSQLPFIHQWVALMPDTHTGMGMPIGGVIATKDVLIPNAVGKDIGCGMAFLGTNIPVADLQMAQTNNGNLVQAIIGDILRNIPVGFNSHKQPQPSPVLAQAQASLSKYARQTELVDEMQKAPFQLGTLGGGNHFIELQVDDDGLLGLMVHSGSRHLGAQICDYFQREATELNKRLGDTLPSEHQLAYLPINSPQGQDYLNWMNLALDYATENRTMMLAQVMAIVKKWVTKHMDLSITYTQEINCHHNYAAKEHHYDQDVWVHRKGATRANFDEIAIIPGAMGSYSYIVRGLGNPESFCSSSHGAGRLYSRKGALAAFSGESVIVDLKKQGVVLGKSKKTDIAEESRFAYKDIDQVMRNQQDLVQPIKRLKTIGVVKG